MSRVVGCLLACALPLVAACATDDARPGLRGACGHAGGTLIGCEDDPVVDAESACWRLVDCGAIPVLKREEASCRFDWPFCVDHLDGLRQEHYDFAIACIAHAHCDDLWFAHSPDEPRCDRGFPACLSFGNQ